MATDKVRAAARRIGELHRRFADRFGRKEAKAHSMVYLRGLMLAEGRKNVEAMALQFAESPDGGCVGQNEVLTLQNFLTDSPWSSGDVQREIQAVFAEGMGERRTATPRGARSEGAQIQIANGNRLGAVSTHASARTCSV